MEIEVKRVTDWQRVVNAARMTVNKRFIEKEPSEDFKRKIMLSEHSPIRMLEFDITIRNLPYWVHAELIRHHIGAEPFVTTSRPDRTGGKSRHELRQDALVSMTYAVNAQTLINVSRKRLCNKAAKGMQEVWARVIAKVAEVEPIVAEYCVPNCVYRSRCPEIEPCGFCNTARFKAMHNKYWNLQV